MNDIYRYLNRDNRWLDFRWHGLQLDASGTLRLAPLPSTVSAGSAASSGALDHAPEVPGGVAVGPGGDVYFTDAAAGDVLLIDGCDAAVRPAPGLTDLAAPRGLLYHPRRNALLVADSGNDRIQLVDLSAGQLVEVWRGLAEPRSLAGDPAGDVYVVEHGEARVQKLDALGRRRPGFWEAITANHQLTPAEVAATSVAGTTAVVILDAIAGRVYVVDAHGRPRWAWDTGQREPMGLAADGAAVYLGDNERRQLLVYTVDGRRIGAAVGWSGPVAAVAVGPHGGLYVHSGGSVPPTALTTDGAYRTRGLAWGGPFANPGSERQPWHWLRATTRMTGPGAHVQLYVCSADAAPPVDPDADEPFADQCWRKWPIAPDATETLFAGQPLDSTWIGVEFRGDGRSTPVLSQLRLDFAHETYLRYLPALYRDNAGSGQFLARWLTLFESAYEGVHNEIDSLAELFDPAAANCRFLPWLAGWLALELSPDRPEVDRRRDIAEAFARYAGRGTVAGLYAALGTEGGVEAVIEEPIVQTGWWVLPDDSASTAEAELSVLGAGTVLAAPEPQGAVVGTTAILDGSTVTSQDAYARALFADVAHQFTVRLYRGKTFSKNTVSDVRALLQRHAPAHTSHHVCVIEPYLCVGIQARIGIDTIVGHPTAGRALDAAAQGGLLLGGDQPSRLGTDSELGHIHLTHS